MEENLEQISPILPMDFFQFTVDLFPIEKKDPFTKRHLLPHFSDLLFEDSFATSSMGYNDEGLRWEINVAKSFEECYFPDWEKGDSLELFVDTRDVKTSGFLTRFCHHFVFLPKPIEGIIAKEVTRFRTEDKHELCDEELLEVKTEFYKKSYQFTIFIPKECLHGYDTKSFHRLG